MTSEPAPRRTFGDLARFAADVSGAQRSARDLADARARFLATPPRRARRAPAFAIVMATAALVLAVFLGWDHFGGAPGLRDAAGLRYAIGEEPAEVGRWIAADEAPSGLSFSDGSKVSLETGARARVTSTSPRGAEVLIERGELVAEVRHDDGPREWRFRGGPFVVHVVGTAFSASWDPTREVLEVSVREGAVRVEGPLLPPDRTVVAGERLFVSLPDRRMELVSTGTAHAAQPTQPEAPASGGVAAPVEIAPSAAASVSGPTARALPGATGAGARFRELARSGKHKEAMAALSDSEFQGLLGESAAGELLALSDAARLGGRPDRAKAALLAARKRGAKGASAFLLGKIAADQLAAPGEAIGWFELYLSEQPAGPLAEQALGRVLELSRGSKGRGRSAAERYLAKYPNGAYAPLARSLLESGG